MLDWTDLRYFLAVSRKGTISGAARTLKVNASTVARRLDALEASLGSRLFDRRAQGYRLSAAGQRLVAGAEEVEAQVLALERTASGEQLEARGRVTIATTEGVANSLLVPALGELIEAHPELELAVVTGNQALNLDRQEADLALRLVKPRRSDLVAVPLGVLRFALYGSESYCRRCTAPVREGLAGHTVVSHTDELAHLPQSAWFSQFGREGRVGLRCNSIPTMAAAAEADLGLAVLPISVARHLPTLRQVVAPDLLPSLGVWMVLHREVRRTARVRLVADHLRRRLTAALQV